MDEELEAGFARQGFATLDRFLRSLAQRRDVDYADLATEPSRFKDAGGTDFTCTVTIRIKFRGVPLIRLSGYGYGTSARDAKLIALAESLERLGFCLRGWHNSTPPATAALCSRHRPPRTTRTVPAFTALRSRRSRAPSASFSKETPFSLPGIRAIPCRSAASRAAIACIPGSAGSRPRAGISGSTAGRMTGCLPRSWGCP